jgi:hypothetical protein
MEVASRNGPRLPVQGEEQIVQFTEVTHLLGCTREVRETVQISKAKDKEASGEGDKKSPKRVKKELKLGDESFQIRAMSSKEFAQVAVERVVATARFNDKQNAKNPLEGLSQLASYSYAQAEYFYDGSGKDRAAWMWNMNWKARLKRFRLPKKLEDKMQFNAACLSGIGPYCSIVLESLFDGRDLSTH